MGIKPLIKNSISAIYKTFSRFPATLIFCLVFTGLMIYNVEYSRYFSSDFSELIRRITMTAFLGVSLSLFTALLLERLNKKSIGINIASYLGVLVILAGYFYFLLPDMRQYEAIRYIFVNISLYLAAVCITYFPWKQGFEVYVVKIISRFFMSVLFALVLLAGLEALVFTIKSLLVTNMDSDLYLYIFFIVAGVFSPIFFLYGVPEKEDEFGMADYPKLFKILLLYVILPLIAAYTVVLYIYFAKIIVTWNLPSGIISYLVMWYSAAGIAGAFLAAPYAGENKWVKLYSFYFSKLIFPLLAMLFIAIGIRISSYGFTENRYIILVLGIWALAAAIYMNFDRMKRNIFIPVSMAVLLLFMVFGPWDAFSVSKLSQNQRFYNLLEANNMINDSRIVKNSNVSDDTKAEISSIINYFEYSHSLKDLNYIPKDFKISDMEKVFGFAYTYTPRTENLDTSYFYYSQPFNDASKNVIDVRGYDYMVDFNNFYKGGPAGGESNRAAMDGGIEILIDSEINKLSVLRNQKEIYSYDLKGYVKNLFNKYGTNTNGVITAEDLIVSDKNDDLQLKILVSNLNGRHTKSNDTISIESINFRVMLKVLR